jgi:hypothetical protein
MKAYVWLVEVQIHTFTTLALYGGECSASRPYQYPHGENRTVATNKWAVWATGPFWSFRRRKKYFAHAGNRTQIIQSVA